MTNHLFSLIRQAARGANRLFIQDESGEVITYADMLARSGQFAAALQQLGVAPGDRVAVQVEKCPDALMLYLGAVRAGAVFLPLNTAYTPAELGYFLGDATPRLFVAAPEAEAALRKVAEGAGSRLETLGPKGAGSLAALVAKQSGEFADIAREATDLAAILYTSGTTGRSKGAMLTHENLASNAKALVQTWQFREDDVLLHALPIFHTHGLFVATNVILFAGASMIFMAKFDADLMLAKMPGATTMMGVPTFYVRLLGHPGLTRAACAHMRLFISGSAPLLAETHRDWREKTGHAILERYGMTETNMNSSNPFSGERRAGTVGFPLPGIEIRVSEAQSGAPLPQGEIGMIEVKGPNVFAGYWQNPEKTKAEFRADGFFITGDLGKFDSEGYLHIVGRGKDLIITGGYNVYPKEIETELDALPGVLESAVFGVPHRDFGEAVTAILVPLKGAALDGAAILKALEGRLAKFKQPKRVLIADELPRNTMGKVQKNILRDTYRDLYG